MADKRDQKRHRKRLTLKFGISQPARIAFTEDISREGMFIKTTNICPPGSKILIEITLEGDLTVSMEARVMWAKKVPPQMLHLVKKSGMGVKIIRFTGGAEQYQQLCEDLLDRYPTHPTSAA
jgi:hypothetical protein